MSLLCQSVIAHLSASRFDTNNISLSNGNVNAFFELFYKDCVKFFYLLTNFLLYIKIDIKTGKMLCDALLHFLYLKI